jgi:hypothetical protein
MKMSLDHVLDNLVEETRLLRYFKNGNDSPFVLRTPRYVPERAGARLWK